MVLFFGRRPRATAVARDVEQLMRRYGAEAYRVAGEMAWRADAGLLTAPSDSHWHRVHLEVGRQLGHSIPSWDQDDGDKSRKRGSDAMPVLHNTRSPAPNESTAEPTPPFRVVAVGP